MSNPLDRLRNATSSLLDRSRAAYSLRAEVMDLKQILEEAGGIIFNEGGADIASGETRTDAGVAISPTMAAMCVDDLARTVQFIRGIHDAIIDARDERPVRILYAGCGPLAPLAIPLMSLFTADDVRFTMLDIHENSIRSAESIIRAFRFEDRVEGFEVGDAARFAFDSGEKPDIMIIEMLRPALASEPQVAVAINLGGQHPDSVLIPESVTVELALVNPGREFTTDGTEPGRDRINVGSVCTLDRRAILDGKLEPVVVALPDFDAARYRPMLLTTLTVYGDHVLRDYDSGITCPRPLRPNNVGPGDEIEFTYRCGADPHIHAERLIRSSQ